MNRLPSSEIFQCSYCILLLSNWRDTTDMVLNDGIIWGGVIGYICEFESIPLNFTCSAFFQQKHKRQRTGPFVINQFCFLSCFVFLLWNQNCSSIGYLIMDNVCFVRFNQLCNMLTTTSQYFNWITEIITWVCLQQAKLSPIVAHVFTCIEHWIFCESQ